MNKPSLISSPLQKAKAFKIVFYGDQAVGKTSIIHSLVNEPFSQKHIPTIGMDYIQKTLSFLDQQVILKIWDTSNQKKFHHEIQNFFLDSIVMFIVIDTTYDKACEESLENWLNIIQKKMGSLNMVYVLGNKTDQRGQREIDIERVEKVLRERGIPYMQVSAKTGKNMKFVWRQICQKVFDEYYQQKDFEKYVSQNFSTTYEQNNQKIVLSISQNKSRCY